MCCQQHPTNLQVSWLPGLSNNHPHRLQLHIVHTEGQKKGDSIQYLSGLIVCGSSPGTVQEVCKSPNSAIPQRPEQDHQHLVVAYCFLLKSLIFVFASPPRTTLTNFNNFCRGGANARRHQMPPQRGLIVSLSIIMIIML